MQVVEDVVEIIVAVVQENVTIAMVKKLKVQMDIIMNAEHVMVQENVLSVAVVVNVSIVVAQEGIENKCLYR